MAQRELRKTEAAPSILDSLVKAAMAKADVSADHEATSGQPAEAGGFCLPEDEEAAEAVDKDVTEAMTDKATSSTAQGGDLPLQPTPLEMDIEADTTHDAELTLANQALAQPTLTNVAELTLANVAEPTVVEPPLAHVSEPTLALVTEPTHGMEPNLANVAELTSGHAPCTPELQVEAGTPRLNCTRHCNSHRNGMLVRRMDLSRAIVHARDH